METIRNSSGDGELSSSSSTTSSRRKKFWEIHYSSSSLEHATTSNSCECEVHNPFENTYGLWRNQKLETRSLPAVLTNQLVKLKELETSSSTSPVNLEKIRTLLTQLILTHYSLQDRNSCLEVLSRLEKLPSRVGTRGSADLRNFVLGMKGQLAILDENYEEAEELFTQLYTKAEGEGKHSVYGDAALTLSKIACNLGDKSLAKKWALIAREALKQQEGSGGGRCEALGVEAATHCLYLLLLTASASEEEAEAAEGEEEREEDALGEGEEEWFWPKNLPERLQFYIEAAENRELLHFEWNFPVVRSVCSVCHQHSKQQRLCQKCSTVYCGR
jgi:hypothetical protein